jgi:thiamine biosynthesis lipoprotein
MKKISAIFMALLPLIFCFGCGGESYNIYTNIPAESVLNLSDNFTLNSTMQGGTTFKTPIIVSDYQRYSETYFTMNTQALVYAYVPNTDEWAEKASSFIDDVSLTLLNIDHSISSTYSSSYVYQFNKAEAGATIEVDKYCYDVLSLAKSVYTLTDGYYNPAVYYSVQAYGFGGSYDIPTNASELPSDELIAKYKELSTHFGDTVLEERDGKYYVTKPSQTFEDGGVTYSTKIDLGGIGKGYAADKVNELMDSYGIEYGMFNFGSSSMVLKEHPTEGVWGLSFTNPRSTYDTYMKVYLNDVTLSTSGDYEQYYEIDGTRYCHVIDPTTGKPVQTGIMTVTIIGGTAAEDDALTTALMAMGKDKAIEFVNTKLTDRYVTFTYSGK